MKGRHVEILVVVCISLLCACAFLCALLSCYLSNWSPYPVPAMVLCLVALFVAPICCYDEYESVMGDIAWFISGSCVALGGGLVVVLWHASELTNISSLLMIVSIVTIVIGFSLFYYCVCFGKRSD